ncbi:MAG: thioredoxin domain-containing protein [Eubacteriaceae bacterium]|nr:thioredoxin domain-containing protein [Eubacteriaceae bacterium]
MPHNKANKLINEKSPYLLQHAHNPVNWYPWGSEAFEKAKNEDKPIFLSIGYSTCHWCHVMEQESFEDEDIAKILNEHFVSIKVDREQRPDIDSVYMRVCQMLTGAGGWPLSIFMTPEQKPFYAGTYFPKNSIHNMLGFIELLTFIAEKWTNGRPELIASGNKITEILTEEFESKSGVISDDLDKIIIEKAFSQFAESFDKINGGFGSAPKFPSPHNLIFLLYYSQLKNNKNALKMAEYTLAQMYRGGIFDHIGNGFCRYSTDDKWLVPHFEKMLYDNALLLICYLDLYQITRNELYKTVSIKIIDYIIKQMTDVRGGFYSAQDADSEGDEGKYYLFSKDEIIKLLAKEDGEYFCDYFDITEKGNFENFKNIPNLLKNKSYDKTQERIKELIKKVYDYRQSRMSLLTDDKVITSWNCMMITAFAKAYKILQDEEYLQIAQKAAKFIETYLTDKNSGLLYASERDGKASGYGHLDDYAFYIMALIDLYEATYDAAYIKKSLEIYKKMQEQFYDEQNGGYYLSGKQNESLIMRPKDIYDGAIPSGNSVAAYVLLKLSRLTGEVNIEKISEKQNNFMAFNAKQHPMGYSFFNIALIKDINPSKELVVVVKIQEEKEAVKKMLSEKFYPNLTVIIKNAQSDELDEAAPFTAAYGLKNNMVTFYLCQNKICTAPFNDFNMLNDMLN